MNFVYGGAKAEALKNISFRAMAGQTIGVIGGTGAGKSTLVNMIPRFYDATAGQVLIDGKDVKDYRLKASGKKWAWSRSGQCSLREVCGTT